MLNKMLLKEIKRALKEQRKGFKEQFNALDFSMKAKSIDEAVSRVEGWDYEGQDNLIWSVGYMACLGHIKVFIEQQNKIDKGEVKIWKNLFMFGNG